MYEKTLFIMKKEKSIRNTRLSFDLSSDHREKRENRVNLKRKRFCLIDMPSYIQT